MSLALDEGDLDVVLRAVPPDAEGDGAVVLLQPPLVELESGGRGGRLKSVGGCCFGDGRQYYYTMFV